MSDFETAAFARFVRLRKRTIRAPGLPRVTPDKGAVCRHRRAATFPSPTRGRLPAGRVTAARKLRDGLRGFRDVERNQFTDLGVRRGAHQRAVAQDLVELISNVAGHRFCFFA